MLNAARAASPTLAPLTVTVVVTEAGCYADWKEEEQPGFHEIRALSLHLYKKAGKDGQKIAGHASEEMTKNYQRDHAEVVWSEADPDLDIAEIAG
ncbi:hypothetical protein STUTZSP0542_07520 [Stutzerimonas marianensis]